MLEEEKRRRGEEGTEGIKRMPEDNQFSKLLVKLKLKGRGRSRGILSIKRKRKKEK